MAKFEKKPSKAEVRKASGKQSASERLREMREQRFKEGESNNVRKA